MDNKRLKKFFSVKVILIFLLLWIVTNIWMWFGPTGSITLRELTGENKLPDTMFFGYSFDTLFNLLKSYGENGRVIYLGFQNKDFIYPLIYSTLLVGLLLRSNLPKVMNFWIFAPWVAAILDYAENLIIRNQVLNFPDLNAEWISVASAFTVAKWSLVFISGIFIIIFGSVSFFRKRKS